MQANSGEIEFCLPLRAFVAVLRVALRLKKDIYLPQSHTRVCTKFHKGRAHGLIVSHLLSITQMEQQDFEILLLIPNSIHRIGLGCLIGPEYHCY